MRMVEGAEIAVRSRKALHLLAYLALSPDKTVAREPLLDLFWPELDETAARDNLSTTLGLIRRALAPFKCNGVLPLQADRQKVSLLKDAVTTDVEEFEAILQQVQRIESPAERRALLEQALALYTGGPLPGLYSDWAVEVQDRLASRYADALRSLLQLLLHTEDFETALTLTTRAIAVDPYDETAYRARMRACAALDRPSVARETYQTLVQRLRDDLHAAPSQTTRELAERIQRTPEAFVPLVMEARSSPIPPEKRDAVELPAVFVPVLPPQRSHLFGREAELQTLRDLLAPDAEHARLVTITGPGGMGKTRLVLELAQQLQTTFAGGVCFLSLADITDPTLLPSLLAHALRISATADTDLFVRIMEALRGRRLLLILDNYEQLVEEGSLFVRALLDHIETLQVVVTSRLRLELEGEREFPLQPLPTPGKAATMDLLSSCASVRLFVDRAQQRSADFALTEGNRAAVGSLCAKLEGIPLALELAAGWTGMLRPEQMLERMEERFELLVSRRRDIASRHRTLRAAMEGSYRLLTPELQHLFGELAVFRGGYTLQALEEFRAFLPADDLSLPATSLLTLLAELQAHSLLRVEERQNGQTTQSRYRLLETVREFGWKQGNEAERHLVQNRHALYFQQRLQRLREEADHTQVHSPEEVRCLLDDIESDMDNLRTALRRLLFDGEAMAAAQLALDLDWFWMVRNYHVERREWSKIAFDCLNSAEIPEDMRDQIGINRMHHASPAEKSAWYRERITMLRTQKERRRLASMLIMYGDTEADEGLKTTCMEEALALYTELGDTDAAHVARAYLAGAFTLFGRYHRSLPLLEACLRYNRETGNEWDVARILFAQGVIAFTQGNAPMAQECLRGALSFYRRVEFRHQESSVRCWLAAVCAAQGRFEEVDALLEEELCRFEEQDKPDLIWLSPDMCAHALILSDRLPLARKVLENSLQTGDDRQNTLRELTRLELACNDIEQAQRRHTEWQEQLQRVQSPISRADFQMLGAIVAWKKGDYRMAWAETAQCLLTIQHNARWPLLLSGLPTAAALALEEGYTQEAAQLLGSWEGLHTRMELNPAFFERTDHAAVCSRMQGVLDATALETFRAEGFQWTAQHTCSVILRLVPPSIQTGSTHLYLA